MPASGGRASQQVGEGGADRLPGVPLVIEKSRAGIGLETKIVAVGRLLEVDAGEEKSKLVGKPQAGRLHRRLDRDRLQRRRRAVEMRVAIVDRIGIDSRRKDP